ncbi:MAG: hypothetical protein Q8K52_08285 [Thiobacillus sp.]|nr:hypothetical protein [Thiobacillus sp.]
MAPPSHLNAGDVLLADALLATWWIVEGASRRGADVVMAQHGRPLLTVPREVARELIRAQRLNQVP